MNKKELIGKIADSMDTTQAEASRFVDTFVDCVTDELKKGDKSAVSLPGFGQFVAKHRPSREIRNPATNKMMMTKAKTTTQFKPAAAMKDL